MNDLELKKMNMELLRVQAAKAELEYKILEKEHEIERLKSNIELQEKKEEEIKLLLNKLKGE